VIKKKPLIGKTVLIGITDFAADGALIGQRQMFGTIKSFDKDIGIGVELDEGAEFTLPPDPAALNIASRGTYRLRSTGQVIIDPDYVCTFEVTAPVKH
jgi:hypothetical protein